MPPIRTDADQAGRGYQVAPIEFDDGDIDSDGFSDGAGDFRLLDINDLYVRLMLEDHQALDDAAAGWNSTAQQFFGAASALRSNMARLAETWQSDAATLLAERVESAATSFDEWGYVAVGRSYELSDLASFLHTKKVHLERLWIEFNAAATALITPPAYLPAADRDGWTELQRSGPAVESNMSAWTRRALDEVVNPLANRFSEAALSFTVAGTVYPGPTNATVPSEDTITALFGGTWRPEMGGVPSAPAAPARPAAPTVPDLPGAPTAPSPGALAAALSMVAVPPGAVRGSAPATPHIPAGATLSSLVAAGWVGAPALAGRRAPVVPSAPTAPRAPTAPGVRSLGIPAAVPAPAQPDATPPALSGRAGLPATPGLHPSPGAPGAPHLPGRPGLPPGAAPPPPPRLPGRSSTSAASSATPPPPLSLPGSTRPRTDTPTVPGTRGPGGPGGPSRAATPTGPHLLGRDAPTGTPPAAPPSPSSLGTPRRPGQREQQPPRPTSTTRPGPQRVDGVDPSVPHALRSARTTGTFALPDPELGWAAAADPRLIARAPSTPVPPRTDVAPPPSGPAAGGRHRAAGARSARPTRPEPATRMARPAPAEPPALRPRPTAPAGPDPVTASAEQELGTPARQSGAQELGGRSVSEPAAPSRAEERAAERTRRRAEWAEARRRHEGSLSR